WWRQWRNRLRSSSGINRSFAEAGVMTFVLIGKNQGVFSGFDCFDATAVRAPAYGIYARYLSIWRQARRSRRAAGSSGRTKMWATSFSGSRRTKLVAPQV